ncbi:Fc.00g063290.m01.CDS01 [Cosmosporella sp. VM-42]
MRHSTTWLALGAFSSPAAAWLKYPFLSSADESWTPPRETVLPEVDENQVALGFSPRPTEAPELLARMELLPRLEGYTLGPDTCGFVSSNGNSFTCITNGATCSFSSGAIGCCEPNEDCNVVKTTCIDYSASSGGACNLPKDFHTLCCPSAALGECFTWVLSTTGTGDEGDGTFTLLDCSAQAGSATLLDYDPMWSRTHTGPITTDTESSSETDTATDTGSSTGTATSSSSTATNTGGGGGGSSSNVGAIAGGTVGGVAALGLVGLAAFLLFRRNKNKKPQEPPVASLNNQQSPPPNMSQVNPTSPQPSFAPTSPTSAYPSGVPSNYQHQPYDPNMAAYNQGYQQQGYGGYSPQPQQFQGQQYPPQQGFQQQGQYPPQGYGAVGYQPTGSPPPQLSPSPGPKEGSTPPVGGHQEHPAQELPAVNPVGNETNRAELG